MTTLAKHLSAACDAIDAAYHGGKSRTWASRYPKERAATGPDARYGSYEFEKQAWQAANPEVTPAEYTAAMLRLSNECEV